MISRRSLVLHVILSLFINSVTIPSLKAQNFIFSRTVSGKEIIFSANQDFSVITQLTADISCWDPCVSPDGQYVAYIKGKKGSTMALWVMNINGMYPKRLTHDTINYGSHPSWHPNGKQILYESATTTDKYESEIRIVNAVGTNDAVLLDNAGDKDRFPCINPADTNKVVYHYDPGNWPYFSQIRIRNMISKKDEILVDNNGWADGPFAFSPDGNLLLWSETENGDEMRLRTINLTTRSVQTISMVKGTSCIVSGMFDQTGKYIFFIRRSGTDATEVVRCNRDGSSPVVLYTANNINKLAVVPGFPIAYYNFRGNTNDISGYENHATLYGAVPYFDRFGEYNCAYLFNGVNSYISVPHDPGFNFGTGDFSVWAYISTNMIPPPGTWSAIITSHNATAVPGNEFFMGIEGGTGYPFFGLASAEGDTERVSGYEAIPDGGFHAICAARENGQLKLYVGHKSSYDGKTLVDTASSTISVNNNNPLNFGRSSYNNGDGYFYGIIDDVRIYSRALSKSEFDAMLWAGVTTTETGAPCNYCDLTVEWLTPEENPECGTWKQQPVKVRITNIGTGRSGYFTVSYSVDGGNNFISEEVMTDLLPDSSMDYTFSQTADLSEMKTFSCVTKVRKSGDYYYDNDIAGFQVINNRMDPILETAESQCVQPTGAALVTAVTNGVPPYTYLWSGGQTTDRADKLAGGIYQVTVTDSRECNGIASFIIEETGAPRITSNVHIRNISCFGIPVGAIDITVIGGTLPYTYEWSNGAISEDIDSLSAGNFQVTVYDTEGCKNFGHFEILQPAPLYLDISSTNSSSDSENGSAELFVSGGTPPYEYLWSTGDTGLVEPALAGGTYNVVITDANACKDSIEAVIFELCGPDIEVNSILPSSCGLRNGMIDISIPGDIGQFIYEWSNGDTVQDLASITSGDYTVRVYHKDSTTCYSEATFNVPAMLDPVPICMVSVDTLTGHNVVVWQKPVSTGNISSFNIYRETERYEEYKLIGTRTIGEESFFVDDDPIVNPAIQPWKYKLSVTDTCENESDLSGVHKTMHLLMNEGLGNTVNLIWDNYSGFDYYTCHIFRYSPETGLENIFNKAGSPQLIFNSFTDLTPPSTDNYFYFIEIESPYTCTSQKKATSHNSVRSNKTNKISIGIFPELRRNLRNLGLYPNPNNGTFTLSLELEKTDDIVFKIYDSYGRLLLYREAENIAGRYTEEINLADKSPGIYHLQIIMNNGVITRPFVVE